MSYERADGSGDSAHSDSDMDGSGSPSNEPREISDNEFEELLDSIENGEDGGKGNGEGGESIDLDSDSDGDSSSSSTDGGSGNGSSSNEETENVQKNEKLIFGPLFCSPGAGVTGTQGNENRQKSTKVLRRPPKTPRRLIFSDLGGLRDPPGPLLEVIFHHV